MIREFTVSVSDDDLDDLRERLSRSRLPEPLPGAPWSRGMELDTLRVVLEHWREGYDWRAQERRLNSYPQFITKVDGVDIHYFHVRGVGEATPLLLVHGWPGSATEFLHLIGPLTDPAAHGAPHAPSFDVIIPSIPGFGFSGKPDVEGWNIARVADAFDELLTGVLGYERYGAQGGDWGGFIVTALGHRHPENVLGLHLNLAVAMPPDDEDPAVVGAWAGGVQEYLTWNGGYAAIQQSKPMSLAVAQTDSPAGLAAWILEKFHDWSDLKGGSLLDTYDLDTLVTNLMFYWVPKSVASAAAMYYESFGASTPDHVSVVDVPVAFARFPAEMGAVATTPDSWYERRFTHLQLTHFAQGGHFAAMEQPELLTDDIRRFFSTIATQG